MDPTNSRHLKGLRSAITQSRLALKSFRENVTDLLRQHVGFHYSEGGSSVLVPVNLQQMFTETIKRYLISHRPQVLITSSIPDMAPAAADFEIEINTAIKRMDLAKTLQAAVVDAMFCMGIIKVSVELLDTSFNQETGSVFAETVDFHDWFHDMCATRYDRIEFCGNRYRAPFEDVLNTPDFDPNVLEDLTPTTSESAGYTDDGDEDPATMSQGERIDRDEYQPHIELQDVWLPREGLMLTIPLYQEQLPPLRVVKWEGPRHGPYCTLMFSDVPRQSIGLSPLANLRDLHELVNRMYRKLGDQVDRQKTVTGYKGEAADDARRLHDARDGDMLLMQDPAGVVEHRVGGIDQQSAAFAIHVKDLFSYMAGNLDSLAGLGPQADTLGQDKLLAEASSQRVDDMQDKVMRFTEQVVRAISWHEWSDELKQEKLRKPIAPDSEETVTVDVQGFNRTGAFPEYDIEIEPYSMRPLTPGVKLQRLEWFLNNVIGPREDKLMQAGMMLNVRKVVEKAMHWSQMDRDLGDIFLDVGAPPDGPGEGQGFKPPANQRAADSNQSQSTITNQGKDMSLQQSLLGKGVQPAMQGAMMKAGTS